MNTNATYIIRSSRDVPTWWRRYSSDCSNSTLPLSLLRSYGLFLARALSLPAVRPSSCCIIAGQKSDLGRCEGGFRLNEPGLGLCVVVTCWSCSISVFLEFRVVLPDVVDR